ncbi:hypothetical protein C8A00DRAFT_11816, partial [Chaetomidium leptoderma]
STLGKNLIKVPDVKEAAKDGCNKAGNAVNDAADKIGDVAGDVFGAFGGNKNDANKAIDDAGGKVGGATEDACNKGAEIADKAVQLTADIIDKVMGSIAKAIGIKEYYSVHIGTLCEGDYKPLFSDKDAKPNVQKCSPKFHSEKSDLSKKLDEELNVGPFKFKLSDLDLVDDIQKAFDMIPGALAVMAFFFLFAVLALLAGFLCSVAVLGCEYKMQKLQKFALLGALGSMALGWLPSVIGVLGITAAAESIKKTVNKHGDKFGMSAATSPGLYVLLWGSLLFSTLAMGLLGFVFWRSRKGGKGMAAHQDQYPEKNQSNSTMNDSHGFYEEPLGRNGGAQPNY